MKISVVEVALGRTPAATRMPFRFGAVTVREAEFLTCRVRVRAAGDGGREVAGWSGDLLVPRWFRKDNDATPSQDADALAEAAQQAADGFAAQSADTAFGLWRSTYGDRVGRQPSDRPDLLVRGFGVALVERAVLDAVCRLAAMPFAQALREDLFGFRPGDVHESLRDWQWQQDLPQSPSSKIHVRHTVGMLDSLRAADIDAAARVEDGLPQALEEDIDRYGLRWFKIKIGAGIDADRQRLLDLAAFFAERASNGGGGGGGGEAFAMAGFSLDGNEQYQDTEQLAELLELVHSDPLGRDFLERLAWIEQPLARGVTFEPARHKAVSRVAKFGPLILDEADVSIDAFPRALELGYRGISVKNCKGVFRALCNAGLCRLQEGRFQTGEDLTNVGVLPLQQDLVTASVLGLPHVERNGHHYFRGLDHLGAERAERALAAHGDLYQRLGSSSAALRIEEGQIDASSALAAKGYGTEMQDLVDGLQVAASGDAG
ncbi:MAG: hypothetical protein AB8H80_05560 [Planctomycetota bacterium]